MMTESIRKKIVMPCFDYILLSDLLKDLGYPRNAIGRMLKKGDIVRVKKGIYALGDGRAASVSVLANMIYGPSYVSLDFVLSQTGLIPERVFSVTSMSTKRQKIFDTPLGRFEYQSISAKSFAVGVIHQTLDDGSGFLVATPEKALADRLFCVPVFPTTKHLDDYLFADMRVNRDRYKKLSQKRMFAIAQKFDHRQIFSLLEHLCRESEK